MEFLKTVFGDKALTFDQFQNALKDSKDVKLANLASGEYVGKGKYTEMETEKSSYKTQLEEVNKQLENLKATAGANDDLKKQIEQWQDKYKTDTEKLQADLQATRLNSALDVALMTAKVRNVKLAKAGLDMSQIKLDGEKLLGIDGQIEALKKSDPYLFDDDITPGASGAPNTVNEGELKDDAKLRRYMGLK